MKAFNPLYITSEQLKYFTQINKKHNFSLVIRDSKFPEEFLTIATWFYNCFLYSVKDLEGRNICQKVIHTEKEAAEVYLEIKELAESIAEGEQQLEKLINCIEKAEKNIEGLNDCTAEELQEIKKSCEKIENTVKKSSLPDSFFGDVNGPSILVESLFIQNTSEVKFDEPADLSESKALISMEDMESSFPKETSHQPARIFPPKLKKNSKKKRCCGFG